MTARTRTNHIKDENGEPLWMTWERLKLGRTSRDRLDWDGRAERTDGGTLGERDIRIVA